jgi:hypothetical protein
LSLPGYFYIEMSLPAFFVIISAVEIENGEVRNMTTGGNVPIALKEWAVVVKALEEGKQILLMRKGGIAEETRDFQIRSEAFLLYPTYEHQKKELLKPAYAKDMEETLEGWSPSDTQVEISCYAELVQDIEVTDMEQLMKLDSFHIWTDRFAEERLKWKKSKPLHVLLVRVYRFDQAFSLPIEEGYLGCKSWIGLQEQWDKRSKTPVLSDEDYQRQVAAIQLALG